MSNLPSGVLVVGQSGGPTAVINASLAGVIEEAQKHSEITAIYGMVHGIEGALNQNFIDLTHTPPNTLQLLKNTPAAALRSTRRKLSDDDYQRVLDLFEALNVRYFVYIGGNGTMWVCHHLGVLAMERGYDLRVIGVPKTVDNDLSGTHFTPGYPSVARFMALTVRDLGRDLEAMSTFDDVIIVEAMGRNTGWLAASSALLKETDDDAPHLVYVPEIPFDEEEFIQDVARVHGRLGRCLVVVAEGIRDKDGNFISAINLLQDNMGRGVFALSDGAAAYLNRRVRERLNVQTRFLRPGLIGRSASGYVSEIDRECAYRVGKTAVDFLMHGKSLAMVTLNRELETEHVTLVVVQGSERTMPFDYMQRTSDGLMVTPYFVNYALPLIGDVLPIVRL